MTTFAAALLVTIAIIVGSAIGFGSIAALVVALLWAVLRRERFTIRPMEIILGVSFHAIAVMAANYLYYETHWRNNFTNSRFAEFIAANPLLIGALAAALAVLAYRWARLLREAKSLELRQ